MKLKTCTTEAFFGCVNWITKDAAQPDPVEGFLRTPLTATLWLMSNHGAQLRWKNQLGANPNPPFQHSLWEETRVPGENPRLSVRALTNSFHISVMSLKWGSNHRNIRPRMRAPILFQVNKWRLINYSKWPIYKGKLNSPHDILYTTLLGKIKDGGFIRAFLFSFWTPVTWQSTHSRSNISMGQTHDLRD